jgi:hypothetical protein
MSTENKVLDITLPAAEDLTNDQYRFVVLAATGVRRPDSATEGALGILQNAGVGAGDGAVVRVLGVSKLQVNAALGAGAMVRPEYVDAADAGKGMAADAALQMTRGMIVEASGAEDDLASVLLTSPIPAMQGLSELSTPVSVNTAGAKTYTIAELLNKLILRDPNGAARSDVTPTAALIVAGIAGCVVGTAIRFTIRNTADADETITITAGAGVTLSGTMTIAQNNSKSFLLRIDDVGSGTEAATLYSLGTVVH